MFPLLAAILFLWDFSHKREYGSFAPAYGLFLLKNSFRPRDCCLGQSWHTHAIIIVDIITIPVDVAVVIDIRSVICIVARRPQPPLITLSPQAFFITLHPGPQHFPTFANLLCNLFLLFGQDTFLFPCNHG